jgi:hypothetical protein
VGHWTFDEGQGKRVGDSSSKGHHGTLVGGSTWTAGRIGGGLHFHGKGDHVRTTFTRQLDVWSVAVWVQGAAAPGNRSPSGPLHREKNFQISWDHGQEGNRGAALLCAGGKWYPARFGPLEGGRWYHLAATFDGEKLRAYRDGVLVTTVAVVGVADHERTPLVFGKHATQKAYFAGLVDDARVYDRPLGDQDIHDLFVGR